MDQVKLIVVTHCVDPHQFYFKYVNDCVNNEAAKFDCEIQCYGNDLHAQKIQQTGHVGYIPKKNEIILFFDVIFNKWLRGRVINGDDNEITLWCIDNGIFRLADLKFIHPLTENLRRNMNLVHLGGLTLLPAENKLNFDTLNVKMEATSFWDNEIESNFNAIIVASKRISFIQEMKLGNHKFGSLLIESKNDKVVVINEILLQMNKAIVCGRTTKAMWSYVSKERIEKKLDQSYKEACTITSTKPYNSHRTSKASSIGNKSEIKVNPKTESRERSDALKLSTDSVQRCDGDFNRNNDEMVVAKFENFSVKSGTDISTMDDSFATLDNSVSMVISSVCRTEDQPECHQNVEHPNCGHECYLSKFNAMKDATMRLPLQSSFDWINRLRRPVANTAVDEDKTCMSSIIDLSRK